MNRQGQILVEFILGIGIWAALFTGLIWMGSVLLVRQRIHQVARYGTILQASGRLSEGVVLDELKDYGKALTSGRSNDWKFEMGRFVGTPSSRFYRLIQTRVSAKVPHSDKLVSDVVISQQEAAL